MISLKLVLNKKFSPVATRCQMASQLASNYDPLGVASPCLLGGNDFAESGYG